MGKNVTFIPAKKAQTSTKENQSSIKKKMAAYCRVSTDQLEQLSSYEAQVNYYTNYINGHPDYILAGIYADEGISGTNTKKREQFNKMIEDCKDGKIDIIITKSISRFARNTLDCLNYVRMLKELGIEIIFEKENIRTLDSKGEVLLTILSSLAQDESRSISENSTWGIRRKFEQGKVSVNYTKFLGYEKGENGGLVINEKQAKIVRRVYREYLNGKSTNRIARELERDGVCGWNGKCKWYGTTITKMLKNEKHKGDALLQKSYTVDFLTKKKVINKGEVPQYYVEESHPAIIDKDTWEAVQLEMERRKVFAEKYGLQKVDYGIEANPLAGKIICGECGKYLGRRTRIYKRKEFVWICSNRYNIGCNSKIICDEVLYKVFIKAFNSMVENKEKYIERWEGELQSDNVLIKYKAKQFIEILTKYKELIKEFDTELLYSMVEKIIVMNEKKFIVTLIEGTDIDVEIK